MDGRAPMAMIRPLHDARLANPRSEDHVFARCWLGRLGWSEAPRERHVAGLGMARGGRDVPWMCVPASLRKRRLRLRGVPDVRTSARTVVRSKPSWSYSPRCSYASVS
jgi:hypothetical protein